MCILNVNYVTLEDIIILKWLIVSLAALQCFAGWQLLQPEALYVSQLAKDIFDLLLLFVKFIYLKIHARKSAFSDFVEALKPSFY